jgi:ribosome maturation factor RimP
MLKEEILKLINLAAENLGYAVYEASLYLKGPNTKITVKIDNPGSPHPVSHGDCERFSNELAAILDEKEILPAYFLEISSPGINRKIRNKDEFYRFKGAPVKVVYEENDKREAVKGILSEVSDEEIEISDEKSKIVIKHSSIVHANLDY